VRTVLSGYLAAFLLAAIAILWLVQTVFLQSFYEKTKYSQAKQVGVMAAQNFHEVFIAADFSNRGFAVSMRNAAKENEATVAVCDEFGFIYATFGDFQFDNIISLLRPHQLYQIYALAANSGGEYTEALTTRFERESPDTILAAKIIPGSDRDFMLLVSTDIVAMTSVKKTLRAQLLVVSCLLLAIAFAMAALLSTKITSPLAQMAQMSSKLAMGEYSVSFSPGEYKESEDLAASLNYAAMKMSEVETLRRDLVANVSHDLRTPLTMIRGYAELMRDLPGEDTTENLQSIIDETSRLSSLVDSLLGYSRLQAGAQDIDVSPFDLVALARLAVSRFAPYLEGSRFEMEFKASQESIIALGDEAKIGQVVYNFIDNAIKHSNGPNRAVVDIYTEEGRAKVSVSDFGIGIPESAIGEIWERYYAVRDGHIQKDAGTGLGLSIAKSILEAHKSNYGVLSKLGEGSVFFFDLELDG